MMVIIFSRASLRRCVTDSGVADDESEGRGAVIISFCGGGWM